MLTDIERVNFRVLLAHKIALQNLARLEGEPMSVVLRGLIRNEAQQRGVWPNTLLLGLAQGAQSPESPDDPS